jgi:hypothetical protein
MLVECCVAVRVTVLINKKKTYACMPSAACLHMQHLGLRPIATACSPRCCLALNTKRRYLLENMIVMACASSLEHDVLNTKHGAYEKGSHRGTNVDAVWQPCTVEEIRHNVIS